MIETPPLLTSSHIWVVEPTGMREEAAAAGAVLANASSSHNRRQCWRIGCPWCVNHERCRRKNHVDKSTHTHQVQVAVTVSHHPRSSTCGSGRSRAPRMEAKERGHPAMVVLMDEEDGGEGKNKVLWVVKAEDRSHPPSVLCAFLVGKLIAGRREEDGNREGLEDIRHWQAGLLVCQKNNASRMKKRPTGCCLETDL
ncbi:hypothetical protein CFC21_112165 [Triticum aestivum]|nr:uncharacterized protein LOC109737711 isoform X1 [Aegilops tauschii subsp. strangulata]XP_044375435.1 uncharacterized protein LOC123097689 isoform X1 [Triticum aestivum]MBC2899316.1 hypothetical protein [Triticum aestivum]